MAGGLSSSFAHHICAVKKHSFGRGLDVEKPAVRTEKHRQSLRLCLDFAGGGFDGQEGQTFAYFNV
jgi:hypothetical protein